MNLLSLPSPPKENIGPPVDRHNLHIASPSNSTQTMDDFECDKTKENVASKERGTNDRPGSPRTAFPSAAQGLYCAPDGSKRHVPPQVTTTKQPSSAGAAWQSNKPSRDFIDQMEQGAAVSCTWQTAARRKSSEKTNNPLVRPRSSMLRDSLWDESQEASHLDNEPNYAYKETVRCKAVRQGLQCYDCPECRLFYEVLRKTGHEVPEDVENPTAQFGRHRARFAPSETPVDFWELDFVDEQKKRKAQSSDDEDDTLREKRKKS